MAATLDAEGGRNMFLGRLRPFCPETARAFINADRNCIDPDALVWIARRGLFCSVRPRQRV